MEQHKFSIMTDSERKKVERASDKNSGFVYEFKEWASMKTDASPFALEAAALQALSLSAGDTMVLPPFFGSTPIYMNLYIMMVGPSTTMRKTTVLNFVRDLLPVNDVTGDPYIKFLDDVSIQAFMKQAAESGKTMAPLMLSVDEVAGLFQLVRNKSGSYLAGFDKTLLKVYDHTPISIARVGRDVDNETGAFVNVFAATTPEPLLEVLDSDDVESGLLPRFIIFDVRDAQRGERRSLMDRLERQDDWDAKKAELQMFLADIAMGRACGVPIGITPAGLTEYKQTTMKFTTEALQRLDDLDEMFSNSIMSDSTAIAAIKGRGFWQIVKLSGLYALSRKGAGAKVELADVLRAMHLVEVTISDLLIMKDEVGANELERRVLKVEEMLKAQPDGMKQSTVMRRLKLSVFESKDLIGTLAMRGLVTSRQMENKADYVWTWNG